MKKFEKLSIDHLDDFIYGSSPNPVTLKNGLVIGGGQVYPEVNFTLPSMQITDITMPEVKKIYTQMIKEICTRAMELHAPALQVEFELLPELTMQPEWGAEITRILRATLDEFEEKHGMLTALRVTVNDIREFERPPRMRQGALVDQMFASFSQCTRNGADFLAIESTGGKEVHDDAILQGDLAMSVFALGILGGRDMPYLWERITQISEQKGGIPSGDSACGFANTAMVLAEQRYIPRVWAAIIRVMSTPRSLAAFEHGARGPNKDCAYEGVYIKAITGCPIALEGAEAACAHLSPIGNIAKAVADLWSNESVQQVRLLSAMAPVVSTEQLIYATRLMNTAAEKGAQGARTLRDWLVASDSRYDPQAYVLRPDVALDISGQMVKEPTTYLQTRRAALATIQSLRAAHQAGELPLSIVEQRWLERLADQANRLPDDEAQFIEQMLPLVPPEKVRLEEYGF